MEFFDELGNEIGLIVAMVVFTWVAGRVENVVRRRKAAAAQASSRQRPPRPVVRADVGGVKVPLPSPAVSRPAARDEVVAMPDEGVRVTADISPRLPAADPDDADAMQSPGGARARRIDWRRAVVMSEILKPKF